MIDTRVREDWCVFEKDERNEQMTASAEVLQRISIKGLAIQISILKSPRFTADGKEGRNLSKSVWNTARWPIFSGRYTMPSRRDRPFLPEASTHKQVLWLTAAELRRWSKDLRIKTTRTGQPLLSHLYRMESWAPIRILSKWAMFDPDKRGLEIVRFESKLYGVGRRSFHTPCFRERKSSR